MVEDTSSDLGFDLPDLGSAVLCLWVHFRKSWFKELGMLGKNERFVDIIIRVLSEDDLSEVFFEWVSRAYPLMPQHISMLASYICGTESAALFDKADLEQLGGPANKSGMQT